MGRGCVIGTASTEIESHSDGFDPACPMCHRLDCQGRAGELEEGKVGGGGGKGLKGIKSLNKATKHPVQCQSAFCSGFAKV